MDDIATFEYDILGKKKVRLKILSYLILLDPIKLHMQQQKVVVAHINHIHLYKLQIKR